MDGHFWGGGVCISVVGKQPNKKIYKIKNFKKKFKFFLPYLCFYTRFLPILPSLHKWFLSFFWGRGVICTSLSRTAPRFFYIWNCFTFLLGKFEFYAEMLSLHKKFEVIYTLRFKSFTLLRGFLLSRKLRYIYSHIYICIYIYMCFISQNIIWNCYAFLLQQNVLCCNALLCEQCRR